LGARVKYVGRSREAYVDDEYSNRLSSLASSVPLERWYEVVGVVPDFPVNERDPLPRVYHPAALGDVYPARIGVRVRSGDPATFTDRLRQVSAAVNADLQVRDIATTEIVAKREQGLFRLLGVTVGLVMLSIIALSAAGIYSLMSFTVRRRRREIGIRAALGADRRQLLMGIFARVLAQLGAGAAVGVLGASGLEQAFEGDMMQAQRGVILPLVACVMAVAGMVAAIGPAREGLRIAPTDALREE
jgi:hypothetical protein